MKDIASILLWALIALWYLYVYKTFPEAPNPPPRTSRHWLAHKLFWGKRGVMTMIGVMAIAIIFRLVFAVVEARF